MISGGHIMGAINLHYANNSLDGAHSDYP